MSLTENLDSKKRKHDAESVNYVSKSTVKMDTFSVLWSIENFSGLNDAVLKSPLYRGGPRTNHGWQLVLMPNAVDDEDDPDDKEEYLLLHLTLAKINVRNPKTPITSVKALFEISLLNREGEVAFTKGSKTDEPNVYTEDEPTYGCNKYIKMSSLSPSELLVDDVLQIHCRVWIFLGFEHSIVPGGGVPVPLTTKTLDHRGLKQLRLDFKNGFQSGAFSDLSLVTKTKTFQAHKFVLAARSPVFKVMLSSEMQGATQNSVEIQDFREDTVESMLQFVYSSETSNPLSVDQACDLLRMAEKYEVLGLKKHLEVVIGSKLDTSNVLKVLALAEMHRASNLKTIALHFTNKHKTILQETPDFNQLIQAKPNLLNELYVLL